MYGKSFESMYEGSMVGAGINVFAVWSYIITKCRRGVLEINPKLLAFTLGGKEADIIEALEFLQKPDPESRSKECEGRRLVKEGQFQYRVVNWKHYDEIKGELERKEYNRRKQQEYRESLLVSEDAQECTIAEGLHEPAKTPKKAFIKPTIEECRANAKEIGMPESEGEKFFHFYESKAWVVGKKQMASWKSAMSGWKLRNINEISKPNPRNVGIAKTGPSYGDLARAKLERQRMVSQMAEAGHAESSGAGTPGA